MPHRCKRCALPGAALCRALFATDVPGVRPARQCRFDRDTTVFDMDSDKGFTGVLRRGYLRKERLNSDGRRTVLDLAVPGDIIGGPEGRASGYTLEAATDVEVCIFDQDTVRRMMAEDPRFRLQLLQGAMHQRENMQEMVWRRGALTTRERILAFLVLATEIMPVERLADGGVIVTIELTRRDWADLSNTTVESISRTMSQLSEKDLVKTLSPGRYRIRDLALLMRLAGMDPDLDCRRVTTLEEDFGDAAPAPRSRLTAINAPKAQTSRIQPVLESTPPAGGSHQGRRTDDRDKIEH